MKGLIRQRSSQGTKESCNLSEEEEGACSVWLWEGRGEVGDVRLDQ